MVLKMKPTCPKCGSKHISDVKSRSMRKTNKHHPENDPPKDRFTKPAPDFNHPYYCNSCGHYFGGSWGG